PLFYCAVFLNFNPAGPLQPSRSMSRPVFFFGRSLPFRGSKAPRPPPPPPPAPLSAPWEELRGLATSGRFGRRCPLVECVRFFILILAAPLEGVSIRCRPAPASIELGYSRDCVGEAESRDSLPTTTADADGWPAL